MTSTIGTIATVHHAPSYQMRAIYLYTCDILLLLLLSKTHAHTVNFIYIESNETWGINYGHLGCQYGAQHWYYYRYSCGGTGGIFLWQQHRYTTTIRPQYGWIVWWQQQQYDNTGIVWILRHTRYHTSLWIHILFWWSNTRPQQQQQLGGIVIRSKRQQ